MPGILNWEYSVCDLQARVRDQVPDMAASHFPQSASLITCLCSYHPVGKRLLIILTSTICQAPEQAEKRSSWPLCHAHDYFIPFQSSSESAGLLLKAVDRKDNNHFLPSFMLVNSSKTSPQLAQLVLQAVLSPGGEGSAGLDDPSFSIAFLYIMFENTSIHSSLGIIGSQLFANVLLILSFDANDNWLP